MPSLVPGKLLGGRPPHPGYLSKAEVRRVIDAYTLMLAEPRTGTTTPETGKATVRYPLAVPIDTSPCIGAPVWVAA